MLSVGFLLYGTMRDLDARYRESAEELLVETAYLLASSLEKDDVLREPESLQGTFSGLYGKRFEARIYGLTKTRVELRGYVTDARGVVLFEYIEDATGRGFTDTSAWYWAALSGESEGPWLAVTTASPTLFDAGRR